MSSNPDLPTLVEGREPSSGNIQEQLAMARLSRGLAGGRAAVPTVGRYVVLERLGEGGMGVVLRAYDPRMRREVALKLLRPTERDPTQQAHARLLREAQALAQLHHRNVVEVFDVEETDRGVCVAMEYVAGQNLRRWLEEGRSVEQIVKVAVEVAEGLEAAHRRGLVHRDVKPDNILIGDDGRVRVADFGLARGVPTVGSLASSGPVEDDSAADEESDDNLTEEGIVVGTLAYMAPEQHRGDAADASADQYALCVTLWEALYGKRPFSARGGPALLHAKLEPVPGRPSGSSVAIPGWLHAAVARGLSPDPQERWPSCGELVSALSQGSSQARRKRIAGTLAVVGVLGAALFGWNRYDDQRRTEACIAAGEQISQSIPQGAAADLGRWGRRWSDIRASTCISSTVDRTLGVRSYEKTKTCLAELQAEVEGLTAAPSGRGASAWLPDPDQCTRPAYLERRPPLPEDPLKRVAATAAYATLARARGLTRSGEAEQARLLVERVVGEATALDFPPLTAAAHLELGRIDAAQGHVEDAEASLRRSFTQSDGDLHVAADAAVQLLGLVARDEVRASEAHAWSNTAKMLVRRIDEAEGPIGRDLQARKNGP